MRRLLLALIVVAATGVPASAEDRIYSGRVESVYYSDHSGNIQGYTRLDKGLPGTSTAVKEDVWVMIYQHWIVIELKTRKTRIAVPRERVLAVHIGNEEANALNPSRKPNQ
ncbi:MAG: hypothetical protein HN742_19560 [Lentisphaerae bacterium]|jgi:hypothetical protein|nr:hypothetical protein [Lentisphaerota bacterium]MBT4818654.1 hypothetical protein [Lentisphaerota bacterium]MBT5609967.1 hypothetical protein [Lentisphaerota bacterium]MBT7057180.1 hypothetical protein [Lentisphaerota bacterium]MBT7844087.1 hypothetical protein [Lentisphaerota bacterium]